MADITDNLTGDPLTTTDPTTTGSTDPVAPPAISLDQADADYAPGETVGITTTNVSDGGTFTFEVAHLSAGADGVLGTADDVLAYDLTGTGAPWTVTDGGAGDLDGIANGSIQTSWYVNGDAANQAFVLTATDTTTGASATATFTDGPKPPPTPNPPPHDLTFQNTVTINGALFSSSNVILGAGTGLLDPFSQVQAQGNNTSEQGYNTDFNAALLDNAGKGGTNFIHSLNIADLPIQFVNGVGYYRFDLDINESNTGPEQNLSLDSLQIWQASVGNLSNYDPGAHPEQGTGAFSTATKVYDMDAGGDTFVGLNGELQPGSGNTTDMSLLVPVSAFDPSTPYIYLYSAFGFQAGGYQGPNESTPSTWTADSGFEEWNRQIGQVIDGHKFNDLNADHIWEAGEPALAGWKIYLDVNGDNQWNTGEPFAITDANGYYKFTVTPGTYTIREVPQAGWGQDAPNNAQGEYTVTLAAGQDSHNNDFGNFQLGSISGTKYQDADGLASTTGDRTTLAGWEITLHGDTNGDGVEDVTLTTTTDANGHYTFSNLKPGLYTTDETMKSGWFQVSGSSAETLTSGENDTTGNDFVNTQLGSISGTKYQDADGLASTTGDRTTLAGWEITLHGDTNGDGVEDVTLTTTTDANGHYTFSNLKPGLYTTDETMKSGWFQVSGSSAETLTSGENDTTGNDFVNTQLGSISGTKYQDADGLASTTGDRTTLAGWEITLHGDTNGDGVEDVTLTTTTDANGHYTFSNLKPGLYTTDETMKSGWFQVSGSSAETLTSGENDTTGNDFVNTQLGSISGTKYQDADGLASTTGDRTTLAGWEITLHGDTNGDGVEDVTLTTTTDANGHYTFSNLKPGLYTTDETMKSGWFQVSGSSAETLTSGENDTTGNDFVNTQLGSISGTKYQDADGLASTTGDRTTLAGWEITLHGDTNGDGVEDVTLTTTTDANGHYTFSNLKPGLYTTDETMKSGWFQVSGSSAETLTSGENDTTGNDFVNTQLGSISGTKYQDADGLASTTGDRTTLAGWEITLHGDTNGDGVEDVTLTTTTDANGHYTFSNLKPGLYTTDETMKSGWFQVSGSSAETLTSGENDTTGNDFVNTQLGSISGTKYQDADGLASTTGDRTTLAGWEITLHGDTNGDGVEDVTLTTTTDANGHYTFSNLKPGLYTTDETMKSGWFQVSGSSAETLTSGENDTTGNDFVNTQLGSISGTKYQDADGLASTTGDRTTLAGWEITLHGDTNGDGVEDVTLTTTTDANGHYTFSNLKPGLYTTDETMKSGWFQVSGSSAETLTSGENDTTGNDFVNTQLGSISGTKYQDADGLASTTGDRTTLAGWEITLHGDTNGDGVEDVTLTTTTDANGHYTFSNLKPGLYTTDETMKSGWFQVSGSSAETLTSGENDTTGNDFVNTQLGSISGTKYQDADGLASTTGDRTTLAGWEITLHGDTNGDGVEDVTLTTTTDANGHYTFSNLKPGLYTTDETMKSGWFQVSGSSAETLTSGENDTTGNDFVNTQLGSISGTKYQDADGLASTTGDRTTLAGWEITLHGDTNGDGVEDVTLTTTTDANGHYTFSNLKPGLYTTDETMKSGWFQVSGSSAETLTSGENDTTGNDFVNTQLGSISGTKYQDADGLASTTGDRTTLAGWEITLHGDTNGDGVEDVTLTTTTDANGHYTFSNLKPGLYTTDETMKSGWFQVSGSSAETLTSGENDTTGNDFVNTQLGSISGTKYQDADGLASTTGDRTTLAGWEITLHGDTNGDGVEDVTLTTTTDANGHYTFSNLKPGLYTTDETMKSGWFQVSGSSAETLTSGENDTTGNDFVNTQLGSIHGFKFEDMDANGKYDGSDTPMAGITIQLKGDVDGNGTIDTLTTLTDANGYFSFENLRPGTYTVSELFTDGTTWAATVDHNKDGVGDATTTVTVLSGQELVAVSGEEGPLGTHTEVNVGNALTFGNHKLGALGLTPGFWYNHEYVWDAPISGPDNSNGGVDGKGVSLASKLAAAGTISAPDIANNLPGNLDVDKDGHKDLLFTDAAGKSLVIEWDDAREIVGGANGTGGDKLGDFVRYAITTLLNEAGVPNFSAPAGMNANIADWLIANGGVTHNTDTNGDGNITDADAYILNYNNAIEPGKDGFTKTVKASSAAWQSGSGGLPSGAQIFADMNATTDGATGNNMMMSLNQSHVFTTQDEGDHFGVISSVLNYSGSYLQLHV